MRVISIFNLSWCKLLMDSQRLLFRSSPQTTRRGTCLTPLTGTPAGARVGIVEASDVATASWEVSPASGGGVTLKDTVNLALARGETSVCINE